MISLDLMKMSEVRKAADRSIYQRIDYEIMLYCRLIDKWTMKMKIVSRVHKYWPESSGLGNVVDFWLATLPMALPPKIFLHFSLN